VIAIPTVALRGGRCVIPSAIAGQTSLIPLDDPFAVIRSFVHDGFERVYLDADESKAGGGAGLMLGELLRDDVAEIDVAAGVKSTDEAEALFDAGATRVVVGTRALEDPDWLANLADLFPGLILLASQVRDREVVTRGWVRRLPTDLLDLAAELRGVPLGGMFISSADLEGEHRAVELSLLEDVCETASVPVFAAGAFASPADLRALEHRGLAGAVIAASLYTGELDARFIAQEFAE
jgi:phosphoribosylformimino-5-aminoimidazole carboxamide ribotide isomerase